MNETCHKPVLMNEVLSYLETGDGLVLDCTLGGAGHSEALLKQNETLRLVAIDTDSQAIERGNQRLKHFAGRYLLIHGNFSELETLIEQNKTDILQLANDDSAEVRFDRVLADLGYSSDQMDDPKRGFSFRQDGPLDMRLDQQQSLTADEVVNQYSFAKLKAVFQRGGVSGIASKLADHIVKSRPIHGTKHLANICAEILIRSEDGKPRNPATLAFQAIRIEVNSELKVISSFLDQVPRYLKPGGRLAVISFHSLEDKAVTKVMRSWERGRHLSDLPVAGDLPRFGTVLTKKATVPASEEVSSNPRSRSARLRVFERSTSGEEL